MKRTLMLILPLALMAACSNPSTAPAGRDDLAPAPTAAAEREVPGNTPATTCATPTRTATFQVTSSRSGRRAV